MYVDIHDIYILVVLHSPTIKLRTNLQSTTVTFSKGNRPPSIVYQNVMEGIQIEKDVWNLFFFFFFFSFSGKELKHMYVPYWSLAYLPVDQISRTIHFINYFLVSK